MSRAPLSAQDVYQVCDPAALPFETTADLAYSADIIGQDRALSAIRFGIGIEQRGFNLFALGPNGTGKHTAVSRFLKERAPRQETPPDWCYVHNFEDAPKPIALRLPSGEAVGLREAMAALVDDLFTVLPAAFGSDDFNAQKTAIEQSVQQRESEALNRLNEEANRNQITLMRTPAGLAFAPTRGGEVITPDQFRRLPVEEQQAIETNIERLQDQLQTVLRQVPEWRREAQQQLRSLKEEVARFTLEALFTDIRARYASLPEVIKFLDAVMDDVVKNIDAFIEDKEQSPMSLMMGASPDREAQAVVGRYAVNVIIDNRETEGAPVVYEAIPTYANLVGRVEHVQQMGTLTTNFTLIKPGALHKANGGYLLLDMRKVLMQPYAWEGLKNALRAAEIRIESLGNLYSMISTVSLEPTPIPLAVKVVLLGERLLYYLLCQYDPDFSELFKVAADFEDDMARDDRHELAYAHMIGAMAQNGELRHFEGAAVARVIEYSARVAGDASKLTAHMRSVSDLLREANYWAGEAAEEIVSRASVERALQEMKYRSGRIRERMQEQILRETILVDTDGERVGQINGLAVFQIGNDMFGKPTRITARVRLGKGEVVDIERQAEMGGPIHSKGVLILSSFLASHYAAERPFSLSASLVFEQSYGGVDGDSASSAELYALLSALADAPLDQSLAVTGSINQYGEIQAIGGVNEKIEGFFEVCQARGLTGRQGVLIPEANVKHLMLREDVVQAIADEQFAVYPVSNYTEGIALLTGLAAEEVDRRVVERLEQYVTVQQKLAQASRGIAAKEDENGN